METTGPSHPSDQTLSSYGLGKLDDRLSRSVHNHLEQCSECRGRVAEMTSDSFLGRFRDARRTTTQTATVAPDGVGSISLPAGKATTSPPPAANSLPPGLVNHADYEIRKELGRGGMGVVYLAHNSMMGRDEVLKVIGRHVIERPGVLERFQNEIRAVAKLRHPNIVAAYTAFRLDGGLVFAMEYVEGLDLAKLVKTKGPLSIPHAAYFAHQAALGLQHAHERGMVHRDIKPHNLMLTHDGKARVIKVLDFGLAKATREGKVDGGLTTEGQALGTPDYIAPEQIMDAASADIRADLYSLGGTLYYLLTGRPPFRANSLYDMYQAHISRDAEPLNLVRPEVPSELAALVAKLLAKETKRRFQTPGEAAEALIPFFKSKATTVFPQPIRIAPIQPAPPIAPQPQVRPIPLVPLEQKADPTQHEWHSLIDFGAAEPTIQPVQPVPQPAVKWGERFRRSRIKVGVALGLLLIGLLAIRAVGTIRSKTPHGSIVVANVPDDAGVEVENGTVTISRAGDTVTLSEVPLGQEYQIKVVKGDTTLWAEDVTVRIGTVPVRLTYEPETKSGSNRIVPAGEPAGRLARFPAQVGAGKWTIEGDELVQSQLEPVLGKLTSNEIVFGDPSWADCDISFEAYKTAGPDDFKVLFRRETAHDYYGFDLGTDLNQVCQLFSVQNDRWQRKEKHYRNLAVSFNEWHTVKVELRGKVARCYFDGERFFEETNLLFPSGQVALSTWKTAVRFRRIKVTSPSGKVLLEGLPDLPEPSPESGSNLVQNLIQKPIDQAKRTLAETALIPLFNGKDIEGWSAWGSDGPLSSPGTKAIWSVQNGVLHGEGSKSHLFSPRGDYTDFRVRAEVKINDGGNSGIVFRATKMAGWLNGYEAQIDSTGLDPNKTGSLYRKPQPPYKVNPSPVAPDTWFVLEAEAVGNHIQIWVNGTRTVDWTDPSNTYTKGYFAIQAHDVRTHVQIRKMEVREIRPLSAAERAMAEGEWVVFDKFWMMLDPDGSIRKETGDTGTWTISGQSLILRWPDPKGPDGCWIDRVEISADGTRFNGSNQRFGVYGRRPVPPRQVVAPATARKPPADASQYQGHIYKAYVEQLSWTAAEERCRMLGGHLAVVSNREDNQFLNFLATQRGLGAVWLGATDQKVEGKWTWVDGTAFNYQNWDIPNKQPNNKQGLEHFMALLTRFDGTWCDQPDDGRQEHPGFVCQWD